MATQFDLAVSPGCPGEVSALFDDLIGTPFAYGGRGPDAYDCYGLALEIKRRLGQLPPDFDHPQTPEEIHRVILSARDRFVSLPHPSPFCFVTFTLRFPFTSHVGIVMEDKYRFIHVMEKANVCIERLDSLTWKRRITGYYEWQV
jgi:cell wall-associated NlpC family hydrolase